MNTRYRRDHLVLACVNACAYIYISTTLGQAFLLPKMFTSFLALVHSTEVVYYDQFIEDGMLLLGL